MSKGQIAMEFLMIVTIGFTMLLISIALLGERFQDSVTEREIKLVKDTAYFIQNEINMATYAQNGYERTFRLPNDLEGIPYTLLNSNKQIIVKTDDYDFPVNVPEINGTLIVGKNTIKKTVTVQIN